MNITSQSAFGTLRRLLPTVARLIAIFIGMYVMGIHDFFLFYFIHMVLKALTNLFSLDSDMNARQTIRRQGTIGLRHMSYLLGMSAASSLLIFASYWLYISFIAEVVDHPVIDFAKLYSLTILGNILVPLDGVIRAEKNFWSRAFILRGDHLLTLVLVVGFLIAGIDSTFFPYVWLSSALIMASLTAGLGIFHLVRLGPASEPAGSVSKQSIWQNVVDYSVVRTNSRAIVLATKGVISAVLGPFAGLTLKAIRFNDDNRRERYLTKFKKKPLVKRLDGPYLDVIKRHITKERVLRTLLITALAILTAIIMFRQTLPDLSVLGLLVVVAKLLSISLRTIILDMLASSSPDLLPVDENDDEAA